MAETAPRKPLPDHPGPLPHRAKIPAAAAAYGISPKTLRRMVTDGKLSGYRLGKQIVLVDLDELEALLKPVRAVAGGAA